MTEQKQALQEPVIGKDEMNLAEFPLSVIGKRAPGNLKTLHFQDEVWDRSLEQYVPRRLTITGSDLLGLPNSLDDEVLLGCVQLTKEAGFADRKVRFTRYELMDLIGWARDGRNYARISESLDRWAGTLIISDKAYWDKANQCWVKDSFNILDRVLLSDREDPSRGKRKRSAIIWGDFMWQSFRAGNLKTLDYSFWQSLDSPVSKRLYRLLDKRFHKRKVVTFDLHRLAFDKVGLSRNMHTGQIKEKLKPAHEELKDRGVCDAKYVKRARGSWDVVYDDVRHAKQLPGKGDKANAKSSKLVKTLTERGIPNANELVTKYSAKRIADALENFDDRVAHGEDLGPGWLGKAIIHPEGFSFRKGYRSKAAIVAAAKAKARLKQEEAAKNAEEAAQVEREASAAYERREQFLKKIAAFSESERERLESAAIRQAHTNGNGFLADHVQRSRREGQPLEDAGFLRQQLWQDYILGTVTLSVDDEGGEGSRPSDKAVSRVTS